MKDIIRRILTEETDMLDKDILNFLRRRGNLKTQKFGDNFETQTISFNVSGEIYGVTSFMSKKEMVNKILKMLNENDVISLGEYNPNTLDTDRQKVVKTIKYYLNNLFKNLN